LVENIIEETKDNQNYLSIIDCTELGNVSASDWSVIIIIHTLQIHEMPKEANKFLSNKDDLANVLLISTSGAGDDRVENFDVDAISSPSRIVAIPQIMQWLDIKLNEKIELKQVVVNMNSN